ncbi:hypothetical protein [Spiroplasma phoeniceum]|uniref:Uncharacterized protein n=1 Tax=Spiroplasma phoeniceum P40 TaxID=1276259 RepID=A0A345DM19_9MOLU|nr:hypothetical protein [Spiroplasma phoeniceum]AXF95257.1 hypothetical protein SDAV_00262 [Spiroplasma phoeniceum P40]
MIISIEENKLSFNKDFLDNITIEIALKLLGEIGKKIKWEKVTISYTPDSSKYIDIPEFSEEYRYQVWLSPTNRKGAEGMLWLEPPYFTGTKENKTLSKHQATCFIDDIDKTPYSIALYSASGRVYLTNGSEGSNIPINSVWVLRQEV